MYILSDAANNASGSIICGFYFVEHRNQTFAAGFMDDVEEVERAYDSNPYVCGMGKDNLFAKGEIQE